MADDDSRAHLLIVDSDAICRNCLKEIFLRYSCKVSTAENGLQAMRLLGLVDDTAVSITKVDTVIIDTAVMDYETPAGMMGYELVKKLKESPATKDSKVVFTSAAEDWISEGNKSKTAGAKDYMFLNKRFLGDFGKTLIEKRW